MSNATIINRISEVVIAFERGELGATAIAQSIELHEPALEMLPRELRDRLHKLSVQVLEQDLSPLEERMLGLRASRQALEELKAVLALICEANS
jgi:hypothetical protein